MKFSKLKREELKKRVQNEQKIVMYNQKKLLTYWRKIMRIAKTEQLKNDIDIYSQNNQRELDSKEAFIQMLDKNIDEAEDQYQMALRNHLIHLEEMILLQNSRLKGLHEEFERDLKIIEEEFDRVYIYLFLLYFLFFLSIFCIFLYFLCFFIILFYFFTKKEREEMIRNHKNKVREVENMIETVTEEEKKKSEEAKNEHQTYIFFSLKNLKFFPLDSLKKRKIKMLKMKAQCEQH